MNISSGIDLIKISRIEKALERHGKRFIERIFSEAEIERLRGFQPGGPIPGLSRLRWQPVLLPKRPAQKPWVPGSDPCRGKKWRSSMNPVGNPRFA
jgi:hypothetical protein